MSGFRRAHQLVQIVVPVPNKEIRREYIEIPGYLYYYEPFEQDMFVHHKVVLNIRNRRYEMQSSWAVSEPRTGLVLDYRAAYNTRKVAVDMAHTRMTQVSRKEYHKAVLLGLANAPERKPRWRFPTAKSAAVKVEVGNVHRE